MKNIIKAIESCLTSRTITLEEREQIDRLLDERCGATEGFESKDRTIARLRKTITQFQKNNLSLEKRENTAPEETQKPKWIAPDGTELEWMELDVEYYDEEAETYLSTTLGVWGKILEENPVVEKPNPGIYLQNGKHLWAPRWLCRLLVFLKPSKD
jgi:hypothetical protein